MLARAPQRHCHCAKCIWCECEAGMDDHTKVLCAQVLAIRSIDVLPLTKRAKLL